jgi:hypothetical protein
METQIVKISKVKSNPNNPRLIKDDKFKKLVKSIQEFPEMMKIRPIVVNEDMIVLGGNMRLRACKDAGLKEIPIIKASELTEKQQREFVVKDNVGFGEWDWDLIANEWNATDLNDWGLDVWQPEEEVDYSILDDTNINSELQQKIDGVKKAIQIEFESHDYEEAMELVSRFRKSDVYIGGLILEHLREKSFSL